MKINELMAEIIQKVIYENSRGYENRFRRNVESMLESKALDLERKDALKKLDALFKTHGEKEATIENLQPLKNFLTQRWDVIRGTDSAYCYTCRNALTRLCVDIAEVLSPIFSQHKFKLLMPTISTKNEVSLKELDEDDEDAVESENETLQLHAFILSDNDINLINVFDCLSYASEDMQLKHTHVLAENKKKLLSEEEKKRVINHSLESKAYYDAIWELHEVKVNGQNMGAFIRRLIDRLKVGGERGGRDGTAETAGQDAIQGIKEFYEFIKTFDAAEKKKLYSCFSTFNCIAMTFELCWSHLLSRAAIDGKIEVPETELANIIELLSLNPMNSVPCVELISQDLERILNNHPELFHTYPQNEEISTRVALDMCQSRYQEAQDNLFESLKEGENLVIYRYGDQGKKRLLVQFYKSLIKNLDDLKVVTIEVPFLHRLVLFRDVLGKEALQSIIKNVADLKKVLITLLDISIHVSFFNILGKEYMQSLVENVDDLNEIIQVLCQSQHMIFLRDILGKKYLSEIINDDEDVKKLLHTLPKITRAEVITLLNISSIRFWNSEPNDSSSGSSSAMPYFSFFSPANNDTVIEVEENDEDVVEHHFDIV